MPIWNQPLDVIVGCRGRSEFLGLQQRVRQVHEQPCADDEADDGVECHERGFRRSQPATYAVASAKNNTVTAMKIASIMMNTQASASRRYLARTLERQDEASDEHRLTGHEFVRWSRVETSLVASRTVVPVLEPRDRLCSVPGSAVLDA